MTGFGIVLFGLLPVLVIVGILAAVVAGRRRATRLTFDTEAYPGLVALRRSTMAFRWVGLAVGIPLGLATIPIGRGAPLAFASPLVTGLVTVIAILIGQQLFYSRARTEGSAGVETRRVRDYLPTRPLFWTSVATVALLVTTMFTTLAASPDDGGRPGRALTSVWMDPLWEADEAGALQRTDVPHVGTVSPFPGSFYTLAIIVGLALLVAIAAAALVLTARRPRNGADPELVRVDDALRRITAEGIVAASGMGVAGSLLGTSTIAYMQFGHHPDVPVNLASTYLLALVALGALIASLGFIVVVLVPGNGERR